MIQPNYVDGSSSVPINDCSLIPIGRYTKAMSFTVKLHQFGYVNDDLKFLPHSGENE
jgi:hypothetical protein